MSRKLAREMAFKIIFETSFQKDEKIDELKNMLININDGEENDLSEEDNNYIMQITNGIKEKESELDEHIKNHLKGWTMERISKVDIAILRLAIYEVLYRDDIPYKVSVNEAVELAKEYSDDSSPAFINGVLAEIINKKDGGENV